MSLFGLAFLLYVFHILHRETNIREGFVCNKKRFGNVFLLSFDGHCFAMK